ncbi:hemolysin-iii channel protein [Grosmannia clavigera kw1407]|uniref:Hemolysin-iii channel protein n=1 Tax=Grosmannia clavigera (strain kw1407 / UAMH 11150) TaxID=655863 RepID=F0XPD7_GROCL|nr:hemolysin-iii channel protein [Grosmannia clavigera kw1407]EFX00527.1 hemolysin-iii channel protein [Grosmannia clavigera kw1407]
MAAASASSRVQRRATKEGAQGTLSAAGSAVDSLTKPVSPPGPSGRPGLLHWDDLPAWRRDNVFIRHGYRPTSNSYAASIWSITAVHNESVNVWTHLGGAVVAAVLGGCLYLERGPIHETVGRLAGDGSVLALALLPSTQSASSLLVLSCFAAGAVACLGMSATYHALSNHSASVARWGNKLDYSGIVLLIVGSYMPTLYYGLFCHPRWLAVYMYLIILLGLACLAVSWLDHFRTPQWRPYRAMLFVGLGACGVIPIAHSLFFLEGRDIAAEGFVDSLATRFHRLDARMGLRWVLLQGGLYIFGAFLYAARLPERLRPGRFDIWGSSHQIFHVFVLLAAATHLRGIVQAYTHHHVAMGAQCPVPPL